MRTQPITIYGPRTPTTLVDALAGHLTADRLPPDPVVLVSSAADGELIRAVHRAHPTAWAYGVDPDMERARLWPTDRVTEQWTTLEEFDELARGAGWRFDGVVMAPPAGNGSLWIDHVRIGFGLLAAGRRLAAAVPAGRFDGRGSRYAAARALIDAFGSRVTVADGFGPGRDAVVVHLDRPTAPFREPSIVTQALPLNRHTAIGRDREYARSRGWL